MPFKQFLPVALAAVFAAVPALAEITVDDAYARTGSPMAKAGAAFMVLHNSGDSDDRLIAATSGAAKRVELHTHVDQGGGVMKMMHVEDGFVIPAGGTHRLARGGDHVMFMGLAGPWKQGDLIAVTLTFEQAGDVTLRIAVDLDRKPAMGAAHGAMGD